MSGKLIPNALVIFLLACTVTGCAFSVSTNRTPGAPQLPPNAHVEVVERAPSEAVALAQIEAQGNNWQTASDCKARIVVEAQKLGASSVVVDPREGGFGQGPSCAGTAYAPKAK